MSDKDDGARDDSNAAREAKHQLLRTSTWVGLIVTLAAIALGTTGALDSPEPWTTIGSLFQGVLGTTVALAGALVTIAIAQRSLSISQDQRDLEAKLHRDEQTFEATEFLQKASDPFAQLALHFHTGDRLFRYSALTYTGCNTRYEQGVLPSDTRSLLEMLEGMERFFETLAVKVEGIATSAEARYVVRFKAPYVQKRIESIRVHFESLYPGSAELDILETPVEAHLWSGPELLRQGARRCREVRNAVRENSQLRTVLCVEEQRSLLQFDGQIEELDLALDFRQEFPVFALAEFLQKSDPVYCTNLLFTNGVLVLYVFLEFIPTHTELLEAYYDIRKSKDDPNGTNGIELGRLQRMAKTVEPQIDSIMTDFIQETAAKAVQCWCAIKRSDQDRRAFRFDGDRAETSEDADIPELDDRS